MLGALEGPRKLGAMAGPALLQVEILEARPAMVTFGNSAFASAVQSQPLMKQSVKHAHAPGQSTFVKAKHQGGTRVLL